MERKESLSLNSPDSKIQDYRLNFNSQDNSNQGYKRLINLRFNLNLLIRDYQIKENLVEEVKQTTSSLELEFGFNLSGRCVNSNITDIQPSQSFIQYGQICPQVGFVEWSSQQRVLKVDLHLTQTNSLSSFDSQQLELIPPRLKEMVENGEKEFYENLGTISPATKLVLQQILNCPYSGWTEQIYLESKALELIALQSEQLLKQEIEISSAYRLKPADIERVYAARELLLSDLNNPPSLLDLAHKVGLNDCTLKRGFRQVFGTSVFGYLRNQRLAQAKQLLLESEMNIAQVASAVGYSHAGYFAAAFKRAFGVSPKALRVSY